MFHSTRGKKEVSSMEAILNGLADDSGLYVIDNISKLDYKDLINKSYQEMASIILNKFFPEFSYEELLKEVNLAYKSFDSQNVVEIAKADDAYFLELYHGPTLAFKDLALVILPRLMKMSKEKLNINKNITILTATSGDTGGAALNGFKDIDGISICVLYPHGGVSKVQEAQMSSFRGKNAFTFAVVGNFDDCQNAVKKFFKDNTDLNISSANSINIGRLVPQVVYYFYSYIYLLKNNIIKEDEKVNFSVPTGNFGDIFAGFYAKMMGLPINNLICASNQNNVLTDYFESGIYNKNREFYKTNSPSMDILISSNLERFLYYASNSTDKTKELMEELSLKGFYNFKNPYDYFYAYSINQDETLKLIHDLYKNTKYLIDPHTSVSYGAYLKYKDKTNDNSKTIILSTASPFKFPETVLKAFNIVSSDSINRLSKEFNLEIPKCLNYPEIKRTVIKKEEINDILRGTILCLK